MNFNRSIIGGYICRDPELRYTPSGTAVCQFAVAVNRKWKTEGGEEREEVSFIDINAWGRRAEVICQHFRKGSPILVEGRLKQDTWEDKNTGEKRSKLKVELENFSFAGKSGERSQGGSETGGYRPPADKPAQPRKAAEPDPYAPPAQEEEDDIPF